MPDVEVHVDLAGESAAEYFGLTLTAARGVIREVGAAVSHWRDVAVAVGARPAKLLRMASAFEHDDLDRARAL